MYVSSETKSDEDEELKELIEQAISIDNWGIEKENERLLSEEDQKGLQIIEKTWRQQENQHWEIALLWKTEKKMDGDSQFADRYCQQIEDFVEKGYASVSYFRLRDTNFKISIVLVMAKSRVTPLKPMTVPQIELQAALLGSRLAKTIENGHNFIINKKYFWIDSKIVLSSPPKNYKTFVANRIGEILALSNPDEWHWLPTNLNVVDDVSRGFWNIDNFQNWFNGPEFSTLDIFWPQKKVKIEENTKVEKKTNILLVIKYNKDDILFDFTRFSNYLRLIRTAAWIIRFVSVLKNKIGLSKCHITSEELTVEEIRNAELKLIEQAQKECFPEELSSLKNQQQLKKTSRLYKLNLLFDDK
ncbi:hypothetical protein JTB14_012365 [Gonioctena quinquepunctata]|nr:hypothetical protein JTB14_012365 [Gonioctena quinquepunctata]